MTHVRITIAVVFIALISSMSAGGAHAQSPLVYVIAEVEVADPQGFAKEYLPKAQESIRSSGGRFLVAGQKITALEGQPPKRVIITEWESIERVRAWFDSSDFRSLRTVGDKYAKFRLFAVEGVAK